MNAAREQQNRRRKQEHYKLKLKKLSLDVKTICTVGISYYVLTETIPPIKIAYIAL
jgi:hypothetical protein